MMIVCQIIKPGWSFHSYIIHYTANNKYSLDNQVEVSGSYKLILEISVDYAPNAIHCASPSLVVGLFN